MTTTILPGNVLETLKEITPGSIRCAVSSPPYYGLRSYLKASDPLKQYEIGNEKTPEQYIENLVRVSRLVYRALSDDGTFWLNLGDSYAGSWGNYGGGNRKNGKQREIISGSMIDNKAYTGTESIRPPTSFKHAIIKPKNLMMIPARVALALQADGWYLRSEIVWHKPNPMPESMKDRPTKSHEMIYLLTKSPKYFCDMIAIEEPASFDGREDEQFKGSDKYKQEIMPDKRIQSMASNGHPCWTQNEKGERVRNKRDVWTVPTIPYPGAHYAVFPPNLIEPCILAGTSAKGQCPECGAPWVRKIQTGVRVKHESEPQTVGSGRGAGGDRSKHAPQPERKDLGFFPSCSCNAGDSIPDVVLDPFGGSGTVAQVATMHRRDAIICELNPESIPLIHERLSQVQTVMGF